MAEQLRTPVVNHATHCLDGRVHFKISGACSSATVSGTYLSVESFHPIFFLFCRFSCDTISISSSRHRTSRTRTVLEFQFSYVRSRPATSALCLRVFRNVLKSSTGSIGFSMENNRRRNPRGKQRAKYFKGRAEPTTTNVARGCLFRDADQSRR